MSMHVLGDRPIESPVPPPGPGHAEPNCDDASTRAARPCLYVSDHYGLLLRLSPDVAVAPQAVEASVA